MKLKSKLFFERHVNKLGVDMKFVSAEVVDVSAHRDELNEELSSRRTRLERLRVT